MSFIGMTNATVAKPARAYKPPTGRGLTISVEVDQFETNRMLWYTMRAVGTVSLRRFLENDAHEWFQEQISMRFASDGDRKSGPWAPLHDATVDIRRALGYPGSEPINIRSNQMFEFVMEDYEIMGGLYWAQIDIPGTPPNPITERKLATAQFGSNNNPLGYGPTIPRPVLAVDQSDMGALLVRLEAHIMYEIIGLIV